MLKIILILVALYILLLLYMFVMQRQMLYLPDKTLPTPLMMKVPQMQVIKLTTKDGLSLQAWYQAATSAKQPTIMYLHGNASNIANRVPLIKPYLTQGYGVLLLEYRGYGGNPGRPSEKGLYNDARAALQYLHRQGIASRQIILLGESLGTAVAIKIATETNVAALILQSAYSSMVDVAQKHYPYLPVRWFLLDKFNAVANIANVNAPILFLHGERDTIIPLRFAEKLYQKAKQPKAFILYNNAGHNNLFIAHDVIRFIESEVMTNLQQTNAYLE